MGRGRGRGRKVANGRTHEDKGSSGEEVVVAPARKRRGRPQKRVAEKVHQAVAAEVVKNLEEVDDEDYQMGAGGDAKPKGSSAGSGGANNKRNRAPKEEDDDSNFLLDAEENSSSTRSSNDESASRSNGGFRQVGSRRKSTPRRAAEAGL